MAIQVGERIPSITVNIIKDGIQAVDTAEVFAGGKNVLFAVPGAFTPTCAQKHLPGYVSNAEKFKAQGVDEIICVSVNDPFVLNAWGESTGAAAAGIAILGDADAAFTKAIGLDFTAPPAGLIDRFFTFCG